jgi:uncharacterized protein YjbJ (UPF0337 family)
MNWDRIAGNWRQLKGTARLQWGRLTGDYASVVAGLRQRSLDRVRAGHALTREAGEKQLAEWLERRHKADPIHK